MYRQLTVSLVSSLVLAASLWANAGPPPVPKGHKVVEPPVRFEGLDKYPDHVFYLYYATRYFGETKGLVEVKGSEPIKLSFKAGNSATLPYLLLLAMERQEFEKRKKNDASLKWLVEAKDGVLSAQPIPPPATAPATVKEVPVTTYRVTLKDGKLSAEKVEPKKTGAAQPSGLLPSWSLGLVSSLSLAWLGLWFARRSTPPTSPR